MTVHTTYFGRLPSYESFDQDAVFGVVRYPKGFVERITDRYIPAVAPPDDLLNAYKTVEAAAEENDEPNAAAITWNSVDFERRYLEYLDRDGPQIVLEELTDRARGRDVWLVCWEKDARWCHRRLLSNAIVADLEDIEIVHHPDPSTILIDDGNKSADPDESGPTLADFATGEGAR
ncbi:DUF488 family protein [Halosolutus amylolyticus]|uniref:DUF488 family protein n=1 Tax=Halosolutus amylolyticus TaxID=2932267 RepID=A0ABD5PPE4_9EURY|nr:DUF488 family protein [Halosolutus amylolyticus]